MASAMSDPTQILRDVLDDLAIAQSSVVDLVADNKRLIEDKEQLVSDNSRLTFENGALRERLRLSEEMSDAWDDPGKTVDEADYAPWRKSDNEHSDDLADARRDRERDIDWERSAAKQDQGARDY